MILPPFLTRKTTITLMTLVLISSVSCAKKHSRRAPDEMRITAGSQTGGTESQGGLEQVTGGLGGESEFAGGVAENQGGSIGGATSGNDVMGGMDGEPISGQPGGNADAGGMILFPEGGGGGEGNTAGVVIVEPSGGYGGDENVAGGSQNEGGQGGDGGVIIPEPEPNLQYAPQVWRPEQTKLDLTACGNVPLTPLEFKPVYHPGFDEVDPNTNDPIASHWYASARNSLIGHTSGSCTFDLPFQDFVFSWTAPQDGNYTFFADNFNRQTGPLNVPLLFVREQCNEPDTEHFCLFADGEVYTRFPYERQTPTVFMEEGQTVYVFLGTFASYHFSIHIYQSGEPEPPELIEAQARRDIHSGRVDVFFKAFDWNQDISDAEVQFLEDEEGEAMPIFANGNQTWISFRDDTFFSLRRLREHPDFQREQYADLYRSFNFREAMGRIYVYPPPSWIQRPSHIRVRLKDHAGNVSASQVLEIAEGHLDLTRLQYDYDEGTESDLGQDCVFDSQCLSESCRFVDDRHQCIERGDMLIDSFTAYQTDDQVRARLMVEDTSSSVYSFTGRLLSEDESEGPNFSAFSDWGSALLTDYNFHAGSQQRFELAASVQKERGEDGFVPFSVRVELRSPIDTDSTFESDIEPMPMVEVGQACDPAQYQNVCVYGTACMEQAGGGFLCEEASIPILNRVHAVWNRRLEKLSLDLEGQGDVLGYRLKGFSRIEPEAVFILGHTEVVQNQFQSHAEYQFVESGGVRRFILPDEAWIEVINRQGYSSRPFRFEVEEIEGEDPCALIDCLEGFICEHHPWIRDEGRCVPEPPEVQVIEQPVLESFSVRFNPVTKMAWVEGMGQTTVDSPQYRFYLLLHDARRVTLGSINVVVDDEDDDPTRFAFSVLVPVDLRYDISFLNVSLGGIYHMESHFPPDTFLEEGPPDVEGDFELIPIQQLGEPCDPEGYEDGCPAESACLQEGGVEPRCVQVPIEEPEEPQLACLANRLNADLNAWEIEDAGSPLGVRWETVPIVPVIDYEPQPIEADAYVNPCQRGAIYAFTAPEEGMYRFAAKGRTDRNGQNHTGGFTLGISSSCNAPAADMQCEERDWTNGFPIYRARSTWVRRWVYVEDDVVVQNTVRVQDDYREHSALYVSLEEDQTVYAYVNYVENTNQNMLFPLPIHHDQSYVLSVDAYSVAPILRAQGEGSETKAAYNPSTGQAQIQIEVSDLGSSFDLVHMNLEYQPIDSMGIPIVLATLGDDEQAEETWTIPLRQLPETSIPAEDTPFVANTSQFTVPIAEESLDEVARFNVWLKSDAGIRSESIQIQIEEPPVVEEDRDCDPYGFYNRCRDELTCMNLASPNQCDDHPDYNDRADEFGCYSPSEFCPREACPMDWPVVSLNEDMQADNNWLHRGVMMDAQPPTVRFELRSYCYRNYFRNHHHVFEFMAPEPGKYRARISSPEFVVSEHAALTLWVRDSCMHAETDFGCSLENSFANPEDSSSPTVLYQRQYFDEPFWIQPIRTNTYTETTMDLAQSQKVYLFVSASNYSIERGEIPYQLMLEKL